MNPSTIWSTATSKSVLKRALIIAAIVGTVLGLINHGDRLLIGAVEASAFFKIGLTYLVPFSVSMMSSVLAARDCNELLANSRTVSRA